MGKPIGECTIKGKTFDEHLKTEEGRGLLRWLLDQPIKDDKFKGWAINRNKWLKEKLELHPEDVQFSEEAIPQEKETVLTVHGNMLKDHESRIKALENCLDTTVPDEPTDWDDIE